MSYFQKKQRPDQSSFTNHLDESTISNGAEECLIVNSNIFNKSNIQNQNPKIGYSQINQGKSCSPISYLKNFKKTNSKVNQQNIFTEHAKQQMPTIKNHCSLKKQYEMMMSELIGGQTLQQNNRVNNKAINPNSRHMKNKLSQGDQRNYFPKNHQSSAINHPFLNDQEQQSMQELLNSSINQFERFLEQQQDPSSTGYYQKNQTMGLHKTLSKFKSILKEKLEHGLIKQKQEMKNMLNQYVQLITKLLHDKEQMSNHIEELQEQLGNKSNQIFTLQNKVQEINRQKDQHIQKTKQQIEEFLMVIEQFESQAKQENQRFQELQKQIDRLKPFENQLKELQSKQCQSINHKRYSSQQFQDQQKRIQTQSEKIQTLLQLLEKSQQETNELKEILTKQNIQLNTLRKENSQQSNTLRSQNSKSSQGQNYQFTQQQMQELKAFYQQKLQQLEIQHEEEFIQYEKAIKQTLTKKDQCIERLNFIISELREGRKSPFKARPSDDRGKRDTQQFRQDRNVKQKRPLIEEQINSISRNTFNDEQIVDQQM